MVMSLPVQPGVVTLASNAELADLTQARHEFDRDGTTKGLLLTMPAGGGTLIFRPAHGTADISLALPEGLQVLPLWVSSVAGTGGGTTATQVLGLLF